MLSIPSGKLNEDSIGHRGNVFWVIDGATPLKLKGTFSENDAAWLANLVCKKLLSFDFSEATDLTSAMLSISNEIQQEANAINFNWRSRHNYELPSYAIAIIRITDYELEYLILGDCTLVFKNSDLKIKVLTDIRVKKISEKTLAAFKLNKPDVVDRQLKENRDLKNRENGYWIGDIYGIGFPKAVTGRIAVSAGAELLLFSDGFARIVDTYGYCGWDDLFSKDIDSLVAKIRDIERQDAENIVYPRIKRSDDVSVMKLVIGS